MIPVVMQVARIEAEPMSAEGGWLYGCIVKLEVGRYFVVLLPIWHGSFFQLSRC